MKLKKFILRSKDLKDVKTEPWGTSMPGRESPPQGFGREEICPWKPHGGGAHMVGL